ncbi:hypothetical protein SOM11_05275 [Frigoribacterium sp. CFBP9039]|uniref:restriction endonuclease subunit S n=1 Tax=Frigoribacterium sp. CFBP9029 TaxID=3096541 RepID=UPI002A6A1CD9|nr:hypothetical protein [Frigoribacterium sp. CFBP9039]MDY0945394.1 hypothetical protein [Frigoribacterium sp. CFBP9039]
MSSDDKRDYKVVDRGQLVVGFPIDEAVLAFQRLYDEGIVSPAYGVWDLTATDVHRGYLERYLRGPRAVEFYRAKLRGSTARRRSLPASVFLSMPVPVPEESEQRRIAAILDQVDELRAKRRRTLALLDELRTGLLEPLQGRGRVGLREHIEFLTSGSRGWAKYYSSGGTPFLRIQDVGKDRLATSDLVRVNAPPSMEAERTRVKAGDVLLSITADLGRTAVVTPELAGANVSQHLALLRLKGVSPRYVSAYLSSSSGVQQLMKMNRGATKQGLNFDDVRSIRIPRLEDDEQGALVRQLEAIDESVARAESHLDHLDELFASLQHRAFTGQL